jgi:hypothetical protein
MIRKIFQASSWFVPLVTPLSSPMIQSLTFKGLFRIWSKTRQHVWKRPAKPSRASLFSLYDVVIGVHHLLVLLEVKKSGKAGNEGAAVMNAPLVAGQVYDYLMGMHHMGNATAFGNMSTYDETVITWRDGPASDNIIRIIWVISWCT